VNRRGLALLLAVASLAVLGVVTASGVLLAMREAGLGRQALAGVRARAAAEAALTEAFRGWPADITPAMPGDSVPIAAISLPGPARGSVFLRALGGPVFALRASGEAGSLSTQRIELLIEIDTVGAGSLRRPQPIGRGWRAIP
jgi:hypothetical protein